MKWLFNDQSAVLFLFQDADWSKNGSKKWCRFASQSLGSFESIFQFKNQSIAIFSFKRPGKVQNTSMLYGTPKRGGAQRGFFSLALGLSLKRTHLFLWPNYSWVRNNRWAKKGGIKNWIQCASTCERRFFSNRLTMRWCRQCYKFVLKTTLLQKLLNIYTASPQRSNTFHECLDKIPLKMQYSKPGYVGQQ